MNRTVKNSIIYLIGTIVIAVVSFFSTIILTRYLSEQVYAQYGLFISFATSSITVISLGMDTTYTRFFYESGYTPIKYLLKSCAIPAVLLFVYSLLLIEPNHYLLSYIFGEKISAVFAFIFVAYLILSLFGKFTQLTARMGEFAVNYVSSNFFSKSGFIIAILLLRWTIQDISLNWVIFSFACGSAFGMLINLSTLHKIRAVEKQNGKKVTTKEMLKYGIPQMINNVMMLVIPLAEKLIVRRIAGWQILAIYTAASVFYTVVALMQSTIDNIWNPLVFQHYEDESTFKPILHNFGLSVTAITVIGMALCILLRRWLVLILDKSYFEVYLIAPAIMYTACFEIYTIIYAVGINTSKKTLHLIISPIIRLLLSVTLCYLLIPKFGLIGVGLTSLLSVVISKIYRIIVGFHYYGTNMNEWKIIFLWCICIFISAFVMFSTSFISDVCVCIFLFLICAAVINREGIDLIKNIKKIFFNKKKIKTEA